MPMFYEVCKFNFLEANIKSRGSFGAIIHYHFIPLLSVL